MDILIECLLELIMEGGIEIVQNKKVNKWIRYPIAIFLCVFIISIIFIVMYLGIICLFNNEIKIKLIGLVVAILDSILIIGSIKKVNKIKKENFDKNNK